MTGTEFAKGAKVLQHLLSTVQYRTAAEAAADLPIGRFLVLIRVNV
jgi:hypothetical protein